MILCLGSQYGVASEAEFQRAGLVDTRGGDPGEYQLHDRASASRAFFNAARERFARRIDIGERSIDANLRLTPVAGAAEQGQGIVDGDPGDGETIDRQITGFGHRVCPRSTGTAGCRDDPVH